MCKCKELTSKEKTHSVHRFSSFQLALGENLKLPSVLNGKPPSATIVVPIILLTPADAIKVNNVMQHLKSTESFIRLRKYYKDSLRLKLFADASFNSLPDWESSRKDFYLNDSNKHSFPLYWNSSKIKFVA